MLNEEEKKAIKTVEEDIEVYKQKGLWKENSILVKSLRIILNLIEKQDKMIDLIVDKFKEGTEYYFSEFDYMSKEEIKEHFRKKVENEK